MHLQVSSDSLEHQATTRSYMYHGMSLVDVCVDRLETGQSESHFSTADDLSWRTAESIGPVTAVF
jgi:hypothetical protein